MRTPALCCVLLSAPLLAQSTSRVSVTSSGAQVVGHSEDPAISHDGRYVAFDSQAPGLVPEDANNIRDVFLHDRYTGAIQRLSVSSAGAAGNGVSDFPSISADGRFVAFRSGATNFDPLPINSYQDIYLRDVLLGTTTLVSKSSSGVGSDFGHSTNPDISADGIYIVFDSDSNDFVSPDSNGSKDIFLHERPTGATTVISVGAAGAQSNSDSYEPSISADGRFVAFMSDATNLVAGDTNSKRDIFVRDRLLGTSVLVSKTSAGVLANNLSDDPVISADGRYVAFQSLATNLVANDTNDAADVFVHDLQTGTIERVNVIGAGAQSAGPGHWPDISADGRYVSFHSSASDLVAGDANGETDVFRRDRLLGLTELVSVAGGGAQGDGTSELAALSGDGRFVAFDSSATDLVAGDTNSRDDVFVVDPAGCAPSVAIRSGAGNVPGSLKANGQPMIGNLGFGLVYDNPTASCGVLPGAPVVLAIDFNGPLALPLFDGCTGGSGTLLVNVLGPLPAVTKTGVWSGAPGTAALPLPADGSLCGLAAHGQPFFVALPSFGIHPGDAVDLVIGQ